MFLFGAELELDFTRDSRGDFSLQAESISEIAVVLVRPDMRLRGHLNELQGCANARLLPPDTSFEDVVDRNLLPDLRNVFATVLVARRGKAPDHRQVIRIQARKLGRDLLGDAVAEVLLFRISAEIVEWHHHQRGLPVGKSALGRMLPERPRQQCEAY